MGVVWEKENKN
jgi:hypothetical protein